MQSRNRAPLALWAIKTPTGGLYLSSTGQPVYFDSKDQAKIIRNKLGEDYRVTYGPDHKKGYANV